MIVYKRDTGDILRVLPKELDIQTFYYHFPQEFKDNLATLDIDNYPRPLWQYKVVDNKLVKRSDEEIQELRKYGKVLTEEERLLNKLKPSSKEVREAEQTIKILTLIQEVI